MIEEISSISQLSKEIKINIKPMFPFIPIDHVIIDSLHMFLRILDVLTNLVIQDVRILDRQNNTYVIVVFE